MADKQLLNVGSAVIELLVAGNRFLGIGGVSIDGLPVRSGRLPIRPWSQSFSGYALEHFRFGGVSELRDRTRVSLTAVFAPAPTQIMRDHSFDPIHDVNDWDESQERREVPFELILKPARRTFSGYVFEGFDYQWSFSSDQLELFFLLDRASWELNGDVTGAVAISQSSCSNPVAPFDADNTWTTEGVIHWDPDMPNPVMTHNLPRWASHQAFDYQYRGDDTLLGVFEHVDLIRSLHRRDAGAAELKCFDKHIFDQTSSFATTPKAILLNRDEKSEIDQRNLWTWVFDETNAAARAEFGLKEEPPLPRVAQNYWVNFTIDKYYRDLLPATIAIGAKQVFIDNVNKSDMTEGSKAHKAGNMCCGHEYEPAAFLGGPDALKLFVDRCNEHDIQVMSWTNNDQSYASPINRSERDERGWFVKMEDTRLKYGGAYTNVFTILDFGEDAPRQYWVDCLKKSRETTGLNGYLFDSFYNLGFMPVTYANGKPRTMWRQLLHAFKELQEADIHFLIESFGPFGQPQHGCPRSYSLDNCWVCYTINLGNDYTTVPSGKLHDDPRASAGAGLYFALAHKTINAMPLFNDGKRIDERFGELHRRALRDYHHALPTMRKRFLQEDGRSVLWHDDEGRVCTIFNFDDRSTQLPAGSNVTCITDDTDVQSDANGDFSLQAYHTYQIEATQLPTRIGMVAGLRAASPA